VGNKDFLDLRRRWLAEGHCVKHLALKRTLHEGDIEIPRFIPQIRPTPPDQNDTTVRNISQIRMDPTSRDHSDRMHPPHNPSDVGSNPTVIANALQVA
jgi:hypothetical protein